MVCVSGGGGSLKELLRTFDSASDFRLQSLKENVLASLSVVPAGNQGQLLKNFRRSVLSSKSHLRFLHVNSKDEVSSLTSSIVSIEELRTDYI